MPLYSYKCVCGTEFDELASIDDRHHQPCPKCGCPAKQRITPVSLDYLGMGTSLSLPTAADKWAKMHEQKARRQSD